MTEHHTPDREEVVKWFKYLREVADCESRIDELRKVPVISREYREHRIAELEIEIEALKRWVKQ